MAIYKMDDGIWVNTDKAQAKWVGKKRWKGNQHIYVHTGSCDERQTLYRSAKGRYYIVSYDKWDSEAYWMSDIEAVRWLLINRSAVPEGLAGFTNDMIE